MSSIAVQSPRSSASAAKMANEVSRDLLAELNNEGAFLLENGEFSSAIKVLTSALNVAMRDVGCSEFLIPDHEEEDVCDTESVVSRGSSRHHSQHRQQQAGKHEKQSSRSKRNRKLHVDPTVVLVLPTMTEDKQTPEPCNFVYSKPLRVADRYSLPSFVELSLYVVYNLAVAYHLRVLKRKRKGNTRILREILRLYRLAQSIQDREEVGLEPTYTLSLWNNLGQAYKSLGKDSKADLCFANVLSNVVCMIDHGCIEDVDCVHRFLDNIAHILSPIKQNADAA